MYKMTRILGGLAVATIQFGGSSPHAFAQREEHFQCWPDPGQRSEIAVESEIAVVPAYSGLPVSAPDAIQNARGEVLRISTEEGTVALTTAASGNMDFRVGPHTLIVQGRYPLELSDLTPGDRVRVEYQQQDETNYAQSIYVQ